MFNISYSLIPILKPRKFIIFVNLFIPIEMATEIERKYRVCSADYKQLATQCLYYKQGYICADDTRTVRVRIADHCAYLTIKGKTQGCSRQEYEYPIPVADANELLDTLCGSSVIEKHRYIYPHDGHTWEIDEFRGENEGLVVAEIELTSEDERFTLPHFIGQEVTGDPRYYNSNLSRHPYCLWKEKE